MARPTIEPVTTERLPAFCEFLHQHLDGSRSVADWQAGLQVPWAEHRPNHGFMLVDDGKLVGGIGALYADRVINGQAVGLCNITSWCVLDAYRQQSMRLAMAVIGQPGWHLTDLSPTKVVGATLQFLKFKPLDERQIVLPNLPWPSLGIRLLHRPSDIEASLSGVALKTYRDHAIYPWLHHVLLGDGNRWCHVIYKRRSFKGLPCADVLHVGDRDRLQRGWKTLCRHLLGRGMASTHIEHRWMPQRPGLSAVRSGFNAKLYLSGSLAADDIDYLYTETMALDL